MLIEAGETSNIGLVLAGLPSSITRALNAVGFIIAGSFTANMTGGISAFADYPAKGVVLFVFSFARRAVAFIGDACMAAPARQTGEKDCPFRLRSGDNDRSRHAFSAGYGSCTVIGQCARDMGRRQRAAPIASAKPRSGAIRGSAGIYSAFYAKDESTGPGTTTDR